MSTEPKNALSEATALLAEAQVPSPQVDAELLLAHVFGIDRSQLISITQISDAQLFDYEGLVARRANRVPLQHLTGIDISDTWNLQLDLGFLCQGQKPNYSLRWQSNI